MKTILTCEKQLQSYIENHQNNFDDNELNCLLLYLKHINSIYKKFPIIILRRESPDFEIRISETEIGLEHTRASCQTLTHGEALLDECPTGSLLEIPDCEKINSSRNSIMENIKKPGQKLQSSGWGDWGAEKMVIRAILSSINKKTKKLNNNYELYPNNELIIYDNIAIPGINWRYVLAELKQQDTKNINQTFDKIYLVAEDNLFYDISEKK